MAKTGSSWLLAAGCWLSCNGNVMRASERASEQRRQKARQDGAGRAGTGKWEKWRSRRGIWERQGEGRRQGEEREKERRSICGVRSVARLEGGKVEFRKGVSVWLLRV